tara:strand:+ start:2411 stop:3079 length:669 start_codon:yes stop_codon:yes gene_type:complete
MNKYFILLLCIGLTWATDKNIDRYSIEDDSFIYDDSQQSVIGVSDVIAILQDSNALLGDSLVEKVNSSLEKYTNEKKKYSVIKKRYDKGTETENGRGRKVIETNYLINNAETWYMWGTIIMILPAIPWLKESQKQSEIDREMRNKGYYSGEGANPEDYEKMATFGIKPGVIIGIVGWIGSQIKLGEKEYFIKHSSIQKPKLSDVLSEEEITLLILAYNSLLR